MMRWRWLQISDWLQTMYLELNKHFFIYVFSSISFNFSLQIRLGVTKKMISVSKLLIFLFSFKDESFFKLKPCFAFLFLYFQQVGIAFSLGKLSHLKDCWKKTGKVCTNVVKKESSLKSFVYSWPFTS